MELQRQLLPCPGLLRQPLLQFVLLLEQLVYLLVVAERLPHQLSLGQPGMLELQEGSNDITTDGRRKKSWLLGKDPK